MENEGRDKKCRDGEGEEQEINVNCDKGDY